MNPLILLFLEAFLEVSIFVTVNLYTWDWNPDFESVMISHIMAIFYAVLLICGSFFLLALYMRNILIWNDEDAFKGKYDAAISSANVDMMRQQGMVMAIPVMFFARRIVLTITVIFMQEFLTAHLGLQLSFSMGMIYILLESPIMKSAYLQRLELMNEITLLLATQFQFVFSGYPTTG